ncbi:SigB/SigF/SigG family RNA polymerase sigma factor [Yinghuangia sp. ASG 101]|uniref:SigB/SigF/SigG family RNA polymerase sigma factor n=1 Tax=Yinghuangia sp. ASG 101 TaxID=2896848 RepID=UPI001E3E1242|nr:SigB/SigF/SigG family RNA polymerase sigma factor [Yinghuangia sp. ASG 101]UGQ12912.1 SigB/SigF/SigG family RNA polymerase sigma factor [Yinghuangia sp. ASG 101]
MPAHSRSASTAPPRAASRQRTAPAPDRTAEKHRTAPHRAPAPSAARPGTGGTDTAHPLPPGIEAATRYTADELRGMGKYEARALSDTLIRRLRTLAPEAVEYGELRGTIVELNLPLVRYAAREFGHRREAYEDILQTGIVGLIKAVDAYDVDRGVEFASFALPTISGEIKRFFRDTSWPVHVARGLQERFLAVTRTSDRLEQKLGREPTTEEIARQLGVTAQEVQDGRDAGRAYLVDSLDAGRGGDHEGESSPQGRTPLTERLGYDDRELDLVDFRESVKPLMGTLSQREQLLLELRFWHALPQREIAARLGISQMHVSRLLSQTLAYLRERLEADEPTTNTGRTFTRGAAA